MNNTNSGTRTWQMITLIIIALCVGALIGVAGVRYSNRPSRAAKKPKTETAVIQPWDWDWPSMAKDNHWDPFQEMRQIRAQMDHLFEQSIGRLRANSSSASPAEDREGYSSSLDVRDRKDHYEVHAYLPDSNPAKAKVTLDGNELKVEVTNKTTDNEKNGNGETQVTEWGQYDQVVQLPGKVESDKMKVERKNHELLITIPKMS